MHCTYCGSKNTRQFVKEQSFSSSFETRLATIELFKLHECMECKRKF